MSREKIIGAFLFGPSRFHFSISVTAYPESGRPSQALIRTAGRDRPKPDRRPGLRATREDREDRFADGWDIEMPQTTPYVIFRNPATFSAPLRIRPRTADSQPRLPASAGLRQAVRQACRQRQKPTRKALQDTQSYAFAIHRRSTRRTFPGPRIQGFAVTRTRSKPQSVTSEPRSRESQQSDRENDIENFGTSEHSPSPISNRQPDITILNRSAFARTDTNPSGLPTERHFLSLVFPVPQKAPFFPYYFRTA